MKRRTASNHLAPVAATIGVKRRPDDTIGVKRRPDDEEQNSGAKKGRKGEKRNM
jgi:hypothetical protein